MSPCLQQHGAVWGNCALCYLRNFEVSILTLSCWHVQTALAEAMWTEEQTQQNREAQLQKRYQLEADSRASEREVAAAQVDSKPLDLSFQPRENDHCSSSSSRRMI